MKWVKTACRFSTFVIGHWLLNAWMLKFKTRLLISWQTENSRILSHFWHNGTTFHILTYTVWYVWQLKFLVARQDRKLVDVDGKNGRSLPLNQADTKVSFCSSAWLKVEILASPRASRALDKDGLLLFGAYIGRNHVSMPRTWRRKTQTWIRRKSGFTVAANVTRAWSSREEVFWKKSFQTSTGYGFGLSSEQLSSVTKLLGVRYETLGKKCQETYSLRAYWDLFQNGNVAKARVSLG